MSQFVLTVSAPVGGHQVKHKKFYHRIKENAFYCEGNQHWSRWPGETAEISSLNILKTQMHTVLCNLLYLTPREQGSWTR